MKNSVIGKTVTVTVDRPLGSYHPEHRDMYYPINYGYVEEKWVVAPENMTFTKEEISKQIYFQKQYFNTRLIVSE